jgi:septal ring factor EnvC (AmiA/AmiB activator)
MNPLEKKSFTYILILLLALSVVLGLAINGRLSNELRFVKEENARLSRDNKDMNELKAQIERLEKLVEDKEGLYANLAAELHKERQRIKELEEEKGNKKR